MHSNVDTFEQVVELFHKRFVTQHKNGKHSTNTPPTLHPILDRSQRHLGFGFFFPLTLNICPQALPENCCHFLPFLSFFSLFFLFFILFTERRVHSLSIFFKRILFVKQANVFQKAFGMIVALLSVAYREDRGER